MFQHVGGEGAYTVVGRAVDGVPAPLGHKLVLFQAEGDGEHALIEDLTGGGPPRVTSNAYRSGWDATFGRKHVN